MSDRKQPIKAWPQVTDAGHLVVRLEDGQEKVLSSGEISLSSWSDFPPHE
ncbi:MAG: hypothetical protein U0043_08810 [Streptococcus sp.]